MISVLIPVYNVEKYLEECLISVLSQTYKDIEVILVNDGSSDKSPEICDEYAKKDSRVRVIHQKNSGVSAARNTLLDNAKGDFIIFVDSDDILEPDAIELLYKIQKDTDADLVMSMYELINEDGSFRKESGEKFFEGAITEKQYWQYAGKKYIALIMPTTKLYRRKIWDEGLRYPVGLINEDQYVLPDVISRCGKVVCTNKVLYKYRFNASSIMRKKFYFERIDSVEAYIRILDYLFDKRIGAVEAEREYAQLGMRMLAKVKSSLKLTREQKNILYEKYGRLKTKVRRVNFEGKKEKTQAFLFTNFFSVYALLHKIREEKRAEL